MTDRLYDFDAHLREFDARVTACAPSGGAYSVTLDCTAFYPEGGGQAGDSGFLAGVRVADTREDAGELVHVCEKPLAVGSAVHGVIDWALRFDRMQQHSGEHIVSGLVYRRFGYHNVGFHMGADAVTVDFDGEVPTAALEEIFDHANELVWQDLPIAATYPDPQALLQTDYRSKKALTGAVRLVSIPEADVCACCGTHVSRTGEIGLILLLSHERFRGGTRLSMLCGGAAMRHVQLLQNTCRALAPMLSAPAEQQAQAVERLLFERDELVLKVTELRVAAAKAAAERWRGAGNVVLFENGADAVALRKLACAVGETCGGYCAVLSAEAGGFRYAVCHAGGDALPLGKAINETLHGRGGGKAELVCGSVQASRAEIEAFFKKVQE